MSEKAWVGIDLGTSGCRFIAINAAHKIISEQQCVFDNRALSELNPSVTLWPAIRQLLQTCCDALRGYHIEAIAVDATSGSVMFCDTDGYALTPLFMYHDTQASEASALIAKLGPPHSAAQGVASGLAKCRYLQQRFILSENARLVHQADWLAIQLGAPVGITDYNNALKSGYNPKSLQWEDWLSKVVSVHCLPTVVAPGTPIGTLSAALMQDLQLTQSPAPVLKAGTTDSLAAVIASGISQVGDAVTSLGSTLVLKLLADQPVCDAQRGIYSHRLGQCWLTSGASNSGGAVLRQYFSAEQIAELSEQIDLTLTPPHYYPLTAIGERFPVANPQKKPVLVPRPDSDTLFLQGLLTGIADIETAGYNCLQALSGTTLNTITTVGGGAGNAAWTNIRQNKLKVPFLNAMQTQAAYGSALLAKGGLSHFE